MRVNLSRPSHENARSSSNISWFPEVAFELSAVERVPEIVEAKCFPISEVCAISRNMITFLYVIFHELIIMPEAILNCV